MQQLSAADSLFLSLESTDCPMNMGLLVMVDGPQDPASVERFLSALSTGIRSVKKVHNRLSGGAFGIRRPFWTRDAQPDLSPNIHHHRLDGPGDKAQLDALTESVLMKPMDRRLPLMELHLISGLKNNQLALIFKLHHACADGLNALRMFTDTLLAAAAGDSPDNRVNKEDQVTSRSSASGPARIINAALGTIASLLAGPFVGLYLLTHIAGSQKAQMDRRSQFCGPLGTQRSYATLDLPLPTVRKVNRHYASSENELVLTLYSGALRRYLSQLRQLPERSLQVGIPYSMQFSKANQDSANQAGFTRLTLATRITNPRQRLHTMMARCQRILGKGPSANMLKLQGLLGYAPPLLVSLMARLYVHSVRKQRIRPSLSAITTHMPGPVRTIAIGKHKVQKIYPLSVLYHGCGLSLSTMRYGQNIHCGIAADRAMLPDPDVLARLIQNELDELLAQIEQTPA